MKTRKTWTIIHTHEVTVRGSLAGYAAYCPRCHRLSRIIELFEAVVLLGGNVEMFNDLLDADEVHFVDPPCGLICFESLLAASGVLLKSKSGQTIDII